MMIMRTRKKENCTRNREPYECTVNRAAILINKTKRGIKTMIGKIEQIIDCGTIVQLLIIDKKNRIQTINFDHRCFWNFYECNKPLKDKIVKYNTNNKTIKVLE